MKRSITAIMALVFAAGMVSAEVTSENMVGYQTVTLNVGYNMLSLNWVGVADNADEIAIQDLWDDTEEQANLQSGNQPLQADQIRLWNGTGYDIYWYRNGTPKYWQKGTITGATTDTIPQGVGFWFFRKGASATSITFAAQVTTNDVYTYGMEVGYNMSGSGYPVEFTMNDPAMWDWTGDGVQSGNQPLQADQIRVWNGTGYDIYWYRNGTPKYWQKGTITGATTDTIPMGSGFWFFRKGATPIAIDQLKTFTE